jgi:hypothetical protein
MNSKAAARMEAKRATEMIHSDAELARKMEPATQSGPSAADTELARKMLPASQAQAPEAGPSNTELAENAHTENGASPVLDGDLHSPERPNVNAMREAVETQAEMEVGKPIQEKQEEVKDGESGTMEIDAKPGKQIIINIASTEVKVGNKVMYNDGRPGHGGVNGEVLELFPGGMVVQFEDRAEPNRIRFNDKGWMQFLRIGPADKQGSGAEGIGEDQDKITSGMGTGMGGTDLKGKAPIIASWDYPAKKAAMLAKTASLKLEDLKKAAREFLKRIRTAAVSVAQGEDAQGFHMIVNLGGREYVLRGEDANSFRQGYSAIAKPQPAVNALVQKYMGKLQPIKSAPRQQSPSQGVGVAQGEDAQGMYMSINLGGREYALRGEDANTFRRDYAAIPKPENAVNGLVQKYMGKLQPYSKAQAPAKPQQAQPPQQQAPAPQQQAPAPQPDIDAYLKRTEEAKQPPQKQPDMNDYLRRVEKEDPTPKAPDMNDYIKRKEQEDRAAGRSASAKKASFDMKCPWCKGKASKADHDSPYACTQCAWKQRKASKSKKADGDYFGYDDWITGHTALLIDNTESSYNSKRRLVQNALKKGLTADQLAGQFSRLFKKQYEESVQYYEDNAADARDSRGSYERHQLEGTQPESSGDPQKDKIKGVVNDLWYGMGGQSDWEEPMGECDWKAIAAAALEQGQEDNPQQAQPGEKPGPVEGSQQAKEPEFSDYDKKEVLGPMKVKSSSRKLSVWKKKAIKVETRVAEGKPDPLPQIMEKLNQRFTKLRQENPKGYMDSFESRLDTFMLEVAKELNLKMTQDNAGTYIMSDKAGGQMRQNFDDIKNNSAKTNAPKKGTMANDKQAGDGTIKNQNEIEEETKKEAGFNFFFPGQVLKEFYPEIQHEVVDYPNASNSPMGLHAPEMVGDGGHDIEGMLDGALDKASIVDAVQLPGDVGELEELHTSADYSSTSPAGAMGIGRDGKPQILEGAPLRKENDIRGPMFTDEFYGQYQQGPKMGALDYLKTKVAGQSDVEQFGMFLKKVCGEIAAAMGAAFKCTHRPLLDKVPGLGEVQLAQVEQPQGMSSYNIINAGSRVKYLMDKLNDSDVQDCINDAWAQSAVWNDSPKGGYVYEVFVRAESIDTDSMIMKYRFVAGTRE